MRLVRAGAIGFLITIAALCLFADWIAPSSYAHQSRNIPDSPPTRQHWLGTDELGRDSFARLLFGTRVSLILAPVAAFISSVIAAIIGGVAGIAGKRTEKLLMVITDLFLSLPWLFLLITIRALLPLDTSGEASAMITFALLGSLGWAAAARIICSSARTLRNSDRILLARASGHYGFGLLRIHILPNLKPVLYAQFWISIPVFILAEANLGMLGLGVSEPLPSWGGLLGELQGLATASPHIWQFTPLVLLVLVVSSLHLAIQNTEKQR